MFLCLRVYLEKDFYIKELSKESLWDCIEASNYNFDIVDLNNNIILENGMEEKNFSLVKEFLLDFKEETDFRKINLSFLKNNEYDVTNMDVLEQNDDLYYVCDDTYVILENLDNTTFTFYRKDGKGLCGSYNELVVLNKLLYNILIIKYSNLNPYYSYNFEPSMMYTQDKKFGYIKVKINMKKDIGKSRILEQ